MQCHIASSRYIGGRRAIYESDLYEPSTNPTYASHLRSRGPSKNIKSDYLDTNSVNTFLSLMQHPLEAILKMYVLMALHGSYLIFLSLPVPWDLCFMGSIPSFPFSLL